MRNILLLLLLCFVLLSCQTGMNNKQEVIIDGYFTKSSNEPLLLLELNAKDLKQIDSTVIDEKGHFTFRFTPSENPQLYVLRSGHFNQAITLLVSKGEKIDVSGELPRLNDNYQVSNSPGSEKLWELTHIINSHMDKVNTYYTMYRDNPDSLDLNTLRRNVDSLLRINQISVYEDVRSFIEKNPSSLAALVALYSTFGRKEILDYKYDSDLFQMVSDSLIAKYPNNSHAIKLHEKVQELENADELKKEREDALSVGRKFPEIILYDIDNKPRYLSRCEKAFCLVTVWKSTDMPSWELNDTLKNIYKKYEPKGLEVFAISFDTDKLAWRNYCQMNHWDWINVIGYPREKQLLNAEDIMPRVFLLDANKKVLAKDPDPAKLDSLIGSYLDK